jgi:diguanylate cyclase (GGDEF)-like protein
VDGQRKWGALKSNRRERRAQPELVVSAILAVAVLILILTGTTVASELERWVGERVRWLLILVLLNVALIIAGLRRLADLNHENERRVEAEQRAALLASSDAATGLANRKGIADRGEKLRAELAVRGDWLAVVSIGLHRFKSINDRHGYDVGDMMLRRIAGAITDAIPVSALAGRLNGDEFAVAIPVAADKSTLAEKIATDVLRCITCPFEIDGRMLQTGAYAGIAAGPASETGLPDLLRRADIALDRARSGRVARPVWFDEGMERALIAHVEIEQGIRYGLEHQQFVPFFEPQVDLGTGKLIGFEMLARWNHPLSGLVLPDTFIPVAEEHGLIGRMSEQVIAAALSHAVSWPADLTLAVNISPEQLADPWLAQRLVRLTTEAGFPPDRLIVEITESSLLSDLELAKSIVASLKNQGVRLALDDFGTGFSSLSHLRTLPFDMIKIDRSFTSRINDHPESAAIVRAVTELANAIEVPVMVEGIEDAATHTAVLSIGCTLGQGWYFGKPMSAEQADEMIKQSARPATLARRAS